MSDPRTVSHSKISERVRVLQERAHALIPGGAHTYAKGDDQYPRNAPPFIARGKGSHVWDEDGVEYIEYGMGLRAVTLGHAFEPVVAAAHKELLRGSNFTRPSLLEGELAERLLSLIPGAEQAKFTKDGSATTTAAIKLARAYTGRRRVAVCRQNPFISYNDWFIVTTEMRGGIPTAVREETLRFDYNDIGSLQLLFDEYAGEIACVIMEAARNEEPKPGYLPAVKELAHANGALFVLDEMITGFRWNLGGAQAEYGITSDLSTFGKGLANGFSVSALVGRKEIMDLGGIRHGNERVFLLSTTHGAENHGLAAAIATIETYESEPVIDTLYERGEQLTDGVNAAIKRHDLEGHVELLGRPCNLVFATRDENKQPSQPFRTLFMQELVRRGILGPSFVVCYSHTREDIRRTITAVDGSLAVYREALDQGVGRFLDGPSVKPVFRRFN